MSQLQEKILQKVYLQSITVAKRGTEAPLRFSLLNVVDTKVSSEKLNYNRNLIVLKVKLN